MVEAHVPVVAAIDSVAWLDQKVPINAITAVSGGGQAYVFLSAEILEAATVKQYRLGDLARRMVRELVG
ncbi:MAG: hypothetical protein ACKO9A_17450 [Alphaproteobacteria bacterium]